jgi:hypothetical protein
MTTETQTSQSAQSPMNVESQINSNSFNDVDVYEPFEGTPFYIKGNNLEGYVLAFGKIVISDAKPSISDLKKWANKKPWELLICMINLTIDLRDMIKHENNKNDQQQPTTTETAQG